MSGLPESGGRPAGKEDRDSRGIFPAGKPAAENRGSDPSGFGFRTLDPNAWTRSFFRMADSRQEGGPGRSGGWSDTAVPRIPEKIREMIRLYEYRGESLQEKSRNFYRQGKFMEDYEDDVPWTGEYRHYFTTYHDLHLHQLRGYFTWRTAVRRGEFRPIPASLAYMYVYELLCGIGAASPEDSLRRMREFEKGFLDSGIGDSFMRSKLHRWMLDYAVIHNIPLDTAQLYEQLYENPAVAERDRQMTVLKEPEKHTDEEIFQSLCSFGEKKTRQSPVVTGHGEKGIHLFAALWRLLTAVWPASPGDADVPQVPGVSQSVDAPQVRDVPKPDNMFHPGRANAADPLQDAAAPKSADRATDADAPRNAAASEAAPAPRYADVSQALDPPAGENPPGGAFQKKEDSAIFTAVFGTRRAYPWRPLTNAIHWEEEKPTEAEYVLNPCRTYRCHAGEWTEERYENPYFARDRLKGLLHAADKGFRRYLKTGHYLRAKKEEEWAEPYIEAVIAADREQERAAAAEAERKAAMERISIDLSGLEQIRRDASVTRDSLLTEAEMAEDLSGFSQQTAAFSDGIPEGSIPEKEEKEEIKELEVLEILEKKAAAPGGAQAPAVIEGLDLLHTHILLALLRDGSAEDLLRQNRLMPSIVADTLNEALFDEIGDNAVECDGDTITIVEDYREELEELLDSSAAQAGNSE